MSELQYYCHLEYRSTDYSTLEVEREKFDKSLLNTVIALNGFYSFEILRSSFSVEEHGGDLEMLTSDGKVIPFVAKDDFKVACVLFKSIDLGMMQKAINVFIRFANDDAIFRDALDITRITSQKPLLRKEIKSNKKSKAGKKRRGLK